MSRKNLKRANFTPHTMAYGQTTRSGWALLGGIFLAYFMVLPRALHGEEQHDEKSNTAEKDPIIENAMPHADLKKIKNPKYSNGFYKYQENRISKEKNHWFDRQQGVAPNCIILHHTECDFSETMAIFTSGKDPQVNAHFVITEKQKAISGGAVIQMVEPKFLARHAGLSNFRGNSSYNVFSIGIELVNLGHSQTAHLANLYSQNPKKAKELLYSPNGNRFFYPYDPAQIDALVSLLTELCEKYNIAKEHIFSHGDIAPQRKTDVSIVFPWEKLYQRGFGMGLTTAELADAAKECPKFDEGLFIQKLKDFGYDLAFLDHPSGDNSGDKNPIQETQGKSLEEQKNKVYQQFYAHFSRNTKPDRWKGAPDKQDLAWAIGLAKKYPCPTISAHQK